MTDSLTLSSTELALLTDLKFMPMKVGILDKMEGILALVRDQIGAKFGPFANAFPREWDVRQGKISRGDNYNFYPFRVLDFPKSMNGKDIFTFRTLVLWGHHASFHLILAGKYKKMFQDRLISRSADLPDSINLCTQITPWEWEFKPENYVQARAMQEPEVAKALRQSDFIKTSFFMPLDRYMEMPATGAEIWNLWQTVLFAK